jgi:hypothetical protein
MMTAASLVRHDALERRRRRETRPPLARALGHDAVAPVVAGVAAAFAPPSLWLLAMIVGPVILVMGGPWRLFWRHDAALLGRLPIPGIALYRLSTWASARRALQLAAFLLIAAAPSLRTPTIYAHQALFALGLCAAAALAAPAATALAGALIISARTQELLRQATGGQVLPGIVYLSLLPASAGVAIGWAGRTGSPTMLVVTIAICAIAHEALARLTAPALGDATREIAALDAVKLAHVDRTGARGLEKLVGRVACPPPARAIYEKDVALVRRRHPGFYLLTGLAILGCWIIAGTLPPWALEVTLATAGALGAYVVLLGRRLMTPPTEHARLLETLPLAPTAVARAKRVHVAFRAVWAIGLATAPLLVRAGALVPVVVAGAILVLTVVGATLAARPLE